VLGETRNLIRVHRALTIGCVAVILHVKLIAHSVSAGRSLNEDGDHGSNIVIALRPSSVCVITQSWRHSRRWPVT
jgi:hypothetical protein